MSKPITINQLWVTYREAVKAGTVTQELQAAVDAIPANVKFNRPDYCQEFTRISGYGDPFSSTVKGAPVYIITVAKPTNGTVEVSAPYATAGTEITITATPAEGYTVDTVSVEQGSTSVSVTDNKFTMPAGDVTVTVTFAQEVVEQDPSNPADPQEPASPGAE